MCIAHRAQMLFDTLNNFPQVFPITNITTTQLNFININRDNTNIY